MPKGDEVCVPGSLVLIRSLCAWESCLDQEGQHCANATSGSKECAGFGDAANKHPTTRHVIPLYIFHIEVKQVVCIPQRGPGFIQL